MQYRGIVLASGMARAPFSKHDLDVMGEIMKHLTPIDADALRFAAKPLRKLVVHGPTRALLKRVQQLRDPGRGAAGAQSIWLIGKANSGAPLYESFLPTDVWVEISRRDASWEPARTEGRQSPEDLRMQARKVEWEAAHPGRTYDSWKNKGSPSGSWQGAPRGQLLWYENELTVIDTWEMLDAARADKASEKGYRERVHMTGLARLMAARPDLTWTLVLYWGMHRADDVFSGPNFEYVRKPYQTSLV